jgi:Zn-dependent metalloprotease
MTTSQPRFCLAVFFGLLFLTNESAAQQNPQASEAVSKKLSTDLRIKSFSISQERGTPSFIAFKKAAQINFSQAKSVLNQTLDLRTGLDELKEMRMVATSTEFKVIEFQQYFKGIKVEHSRYTAFVKNGAIQFFNGAYFNVPASLPLSPKINESNALGKAKENVNAKKYAWDNLEEIISKTKELGTKAGLLAELKEYTPDAELVIVENYSKPGKAEMRLAYKFNIYAVEPLSRAWIYVDAENGNTLLVDKIIKHIDNPNPSPTAVSATVQTRYAGNKQIGVKQISGNDPNNGTLLTSSNPLEVYVPGSLTYGLMDDTRGGGIETYDLNGVGGLPVSLGAYAAGKSFTDVDNNWTLAEHKRGGTVESENDDFGWDAHWGAAMVYDYWKAKHGRLSFDGNDSKIKSFIHSGLAYDNAFWNGTVMTYGDGSYPAKANGFRPLTSLDVCGHEIGHGVCEFTADLVYAKESGAMNEGFSDIWASCVEYFVLKNVDPSLSAVYKPFYIGEQISANPARPLRRMDNPQAEGDPDTYGGNFWKDPNCSPSLANDQCGVHTNSGVLNKWFYLVTIGSGVGSGPDAEFAGIDDGLNDKGDNYSITGLGFDLSEKITYLSELMLTSSATFAEARNVSINVATALSGSPFSPMVKTVTDAWYAVGVGAPAQNTITYGFVYQPGSSESEGQENAGCNLETPVYVPILLPGNSSATITLSGTSTNNSDYRLSRSTLSNTTSDFKSDSVIVYVIDDGVAEGDETVILNLALTNTGSSPVNSKYILNIIEDDVIPVISNVSKVLLNETFTRADGFDDPIGWKEIIELTESPNGDPLASGKNQWGIFSNALAITGKEGTTGAQLPGGTYNSNSASKTIIGSSIIDARGLNKLQLRFDYTVQGEVNTEGDDPFNLPVFDYMAIVYSLDGTTWYELPSPPYRAFASVAPENGNVDVLLPSFLNNKYFYIGFRWSNDTNAGGPISVSIDNLNLTGKTRNIENDLNHNGRENLRAGDDVYFYSMQDGEVVGRVKNNSTKDFGCTNFLVEKTGTGSFNLYSGRDGLQKVSEKVVRIETGFIYKASTTVSLFFTEAQLTALENATGKSRSNFTIYHVAATAYTLASSQNTKKYLAVYTDLGQSIGGYYTVTINEKANGSYALGTTVSVPGTQNAVTYSAPNELVLQDWDFKPIYPNPGKGSANFLINAPHAEKIRVEILNMFGQVVQTQSEELKGGKSQIKLQIPKLSNGNYLIRVRDEKGSVLNAQSYIKY